MAIFQLRGRRLIALILIVSGTQFTLFGYDQGLFGGILAGDRFQEMLGHPDPTMSGLVTAIYDIGCALGAVVAFLFGERIGRKRSVILANLIVIVGAAIQAASYSYAQVCCMSLESTSSDGERSTELSTLSILHLTRICLDVRHQNHHRCRRRPQHSGHPDPTIRDPTSSQPRRPSRGAVRAHHHRGGRRIMAVLRDLVRRQLHAVAVPSGLPDPLLAHRARPVPVAGRDAEVACSQRPRGRGQVHHCAAARPGGGRRGGAWPAE